MQNTIIEKASEKLTLKEAVAMGIGGIAIAQAGHAAPFAFALRGIIALLTGLSYAQLGLKFQSSGGSFTFLEHAFKNQNIANIGDWLLLIGYVGTMSLYAYTFGVYGSALLSGNDSNIIMQTLIMLTFLGINLYGIKASSSSELLIVAIKMIILFLFFAIGLFYIKPDHLEPVFNQGYTGVIMGAVLVFVAYEGFELIKNIINEMKNPQRNLKPTIVWSIIITIIIYIMTSLVAVVNLLPEEIIKYKEYAPDCCHQAFSG